MSGGGDFLDRVEVILREVRSLPDGQREAVLRQRCRDDDQLRCEVESMLHAEGLMRDGFLQRSFTDRLQDEPRPAAQRIGPWVIDEPLGSGGMGTVYRGRRADGAYEAEVAIKFIRGGTPGVRHHRDHERFLRERQILAALDHPNIARLLDGGVSADGQPYFVMELVRGASVVDACDAQQASITARLALFDRICEAVQYAHGKLIVHRDLKPSNVLVDESGRPRLVDFGIASILSDADAAGSATATSERRFTPQYAAPEQVRGEAATVATDVYALGMILYELLAGARPYEITSGCTPRDVQTICETEPPRPSRRVDTTGGSPAADYAHIARQRGMEPAALRRVLRGDLDHIVMTALRKEPARRYATVDALREDLQRYRRGLPVSARPDSWGYRASRFVSRHRITVTAAAVFAVLLVAAATISTVLAVRLNDRTVALREALLQREAALEEARSKQAAVEREFRRSLSSSSTLIHSVAAVSAADEAARRRFVEEIRDRVARLDAMTMPVSADAEIATRQALATLARTIEAFDIALEQNRRVLALTDGRPEEAGVRVETYGQIGWIHLLRGEPAEAIEALRAARAIDQRDRGTDHLVPADAQLIEALLMVGDVGAAAAVLQETPFPPPPADAFLRQQIRDIESRHGVSLLPTPGPDGRADHE